MMKTLSLALMFCVVLLSLGIATHIQAETTRGIIKDQKRLLEQYQKFLDMLRTRAETIEDEEIKARLLKAINYADQADVTTKMNEVLELVQEGERFDAVSVSKNVEVHLEEMEQFLLGANQEAMVDPDIHAKLIEGLEDIRKQMDKIDITPLADLRDIQALKAKLGWMQGQQENILKQIRRMSGAEMRLGDILAKLNKAIDKQKEVNEEIDDAGNIGDTENPAGVAAGQLKELKKRQQQLSELSREIQGMLGGLETDLGKSDKPDERQGKEKARNAAEQTGKAGQIQQNAADALGGASRSASEAASGGDPKAARKARSEAGKAGDKGQEALEQLKAAKEQIQRLQKALAEARGDNAQDAAKLAERQGELKADAEELAETLKAMQEGSAAESANKAGKSSEKAAGHMSKAQKALGQMGGKSGGESGGGKQSAQEAGEKAREELAKAMAALDDAEKKAEKDIEKAKYDLRKLATEEKEIAEELDDFRRKMKDAGVSESARSNVAKAAEKSRDAAEKLKAESESQSGGSGGQSGGSSSKQGGEDGSSGARKDMEKAKEELDKAIRKLKDEFEIASMIRQYMEIEKVLRIMIKRQKFINAVTSDHEAIKLAEEAKLGGKEYDFNRSEMREIDDIRADEEDLATKAEVMSKLLREEKKIAFPGILDIIRKDMLRVVELLDEFVVGPETQVIEKDILRNLERLREAVCEELEDLKEEQKKKEEEKEDEKKDDKEKKPQEQQKQPDRMEQMINMISELKILKYLQEAVKTGTVGVDSSFPESGELKGFEKKIKKRVCDRLAGKEAEIQKLTAELIKLIEEAQEKAQGNK